MESDAYIFFTECHRLYIQGVRRALRERLESAFGEGWWDKGVLTSLTQDQVKNLQIEVERNPDREQFLLLDAPHFGRIISKHHNEIFSDAFSDSIRTIKDLRRLAGVRNDWAHIQSISFPRARQAAELMKQLLASLSCEEALEVERMSREVAFEPGENMDELPEVPGDRSSEFDSEESPTDSWGFWRQIQSCLVMEKSVEQSGDESGERVRITLKVHNTAPDSRDFPSVHFKSVTISASTSDRKKLGEMSPGDSREAEFVLPARQLVEVEFEIFGEIDADRLFQFSRTTSVPEEVVAPLRKEFMDRLESIGIREFVGGVLEAIDDPDPDLTLGDIARIRESLKLQSGRSEQKRTELAQLFEDFHLTRGSALGGRTREVILALVEFERKLVTLADVMGRTDVQSMAEAVRDLKQVQLAVLRVEDTIRNMAKSA